MPRAHETIVEDQFGPRAQAYVESAVHAAGADLDAIEALARRTRPALALDLGCGGGHVAYRLSPHAGRVIAADLSPRMLEAVAQTALARGLANLEARQASVEALPFADGAFDLVACRFSAHHWRGLEAGLREARRVLAWGAPAIFVDIVAPAEPALDTHLQAVELLRDPSHVRDWRIDEWAAALARCGFELRGLQVRRVPIQFSSWIERMATPPAAEQAIGYLQRAAAASTRTWFAIDHDGSFELELASFEVV